MSLIEAVELRSGYVDFPDGFNFAARTKAASIEQLETGILSVFNIAWLAKDNETVAAVTERKPWYAREPEVQFWSRELSQQDFANRWESAKTFVEDKYDNAFDFHSREFIQIVGCRNSLNSSPYAQLLVGAGAATRVLGDLPYAFRRSIAGF